MDAHMSECCFINADFDLSLRGVELPERLAKQTQELSLQALLGARSGDAALIRTPVSDAFVEHLHRCGATVPRLILSPEIDSKLEFVPFGWNAEALKLNSFHAVPVKHPTLEVVRRVNGRCFQLELEQELKLEHGHRVGNIRDVELLLATGECEWLFKAEHGVSGLANRRLRSPALGDSDRRFILDQFAGDEPATVERWRDRLQDLTAISSVPFDPTTLRIHETIGTRDGAMIGAIFGTPVPEAWKVQMHDTAERVSGALERVGYFGPVCMDAFSWRDGEHVRFRPLVDLNCRRSISARAQRMWGELAPDRALYYRFFNRRKLRLPTDFSEALTSIAAERYDPTTRLGALLASPTHVNKIAVGFFGSDRDDAFKREQAFRALHERRNG